MTATFLGKWTFKIGTGLARGPYIVYQIGDEIIFQEPRNGNYATDGPPDPAAWRTATAWREVEIELGSGPAGLLDQAGQLLLDAGARPSPSASKLRQLLDSVRPQS